MFACGELAAMMRRRRILEVGSVLRTPEERADAIKDSDEVAGMIQKRPPAWKRKGTFVVSGEGRYCLS